MMGGVLELTKDDFDALLRALDTADSETFPLPLARRTHLMAAFRYMVEMTDARTFPYVLVARDSWELTRRMAEAR
jgi:hypothetical protein